MGMDVFGKNPTTDKGEYFRNNVWWWRPLWQYCCEVGAEVISDEVAEGGCYNSAYGLDEDGAKALSEILFGELWNGRTAEYERKYNEHLATLPRVNCEFCDATGIRSDAVGVEHGMPTRELEPEVQILTGRTHGTCNSCRGVGTVESWEMSYPFSVENVKEFAYFLADCGGFEIH